MSITKKQRQKTFVDRLGCQMPHGSGDTANHQHSGGPGDDTHTGAASAVAPAAAASRVGERHGIELPHDPTLINQLGPDALRPNETRRRPLADTAATSRHACGTGEAIAATSLQAVIVLEQRRSL